MIVFSYHPLLDGVPGVLEHLDLENPGSLSDRLHDILDSLPTGAAKACLWAGSNADANPPFPVLLLEQGRAIRDHLVSWAEGDPSSWFELHLLERRGLYALALLPNIKKSLDRQLAAMALVAGRAIPEPSERSVIFRPLQFISGGPSEMFASVRPLLGETTKVAILDVADVPPEGPMAADHENVLELGEFRIVTEPSPFMESILDEVIKDLGL